MRRWIYIILLLSVSNFLTAQGNIHIEKVQDEGLTNYYIKCIQQDKKGFLWFGTEEGLFRYNGYDFKAFKNFPGDSQTLINNNIEFLFPQNNFVWVGSRGGLSCIDITTNKIQNFFPSQILTVYAIVAENDSVFWIGSSTGLFQFNIKKQTWKRITAIDKNVFIRSLCDDGRHHLYITSHNGFYCYDELNGNCKHYLIPKALNTDASFEIMHKSLLDDKGMLWMSTWEAGLVEFDPHTQKIKQWLYNSDTSTFQPYIRAFDIIRNEDGHIWLANSENGLTIFNTVNNSMNNYPVNWSDGDKSINKTYSIFHDRSGIWWIGTLNGIYKYDPHMVHFSKIDFWLKSDNGKTIIKLSPLCMLKDKTGHWWMGTYQGLHTLDFKTGILHDYSTLAGIPKSTIVTNLVEDSSGTIWASSRAMIIAVHANKNGDNFSIQHAVFKSPGIKTVVVCLYLDHENRMWIGTHSNGVFMLDLKTKKIISYPFSPSDTGSNENEVRCFYEISKDSLLVGGEHTGVLLLHTTNGSFEKIKWNTAVATLADNLNVNAIIRTANSLWIATEFNGLWQVNNHFQNVRRYTIRDGLPSMNIVSILPDEKNHLWLVTEGGVIDFQPRADRLIIYDKKDGIQESSALSSIIKINSQNIAIGDLGCIHLLNPFEVAGNNKPPAVYITSFKVFDKDYPVNNNQTIKLKYNQNYFSFEYVALNYTQSFLNGYAYKLEGLDKKWNNAGTRRYVSYAGLKEGTYTFKVKASNNEGVWNNVPATVSFIITPPFTHTWWFYLLIAVFISGIIYFVYRMKLNQWKIRYELRNKIARDLHDDIGSTLSGINIFSKIALQKMKTDQTESTALLEKISDRSKKTMDALSDIVWSINTKNDDMNNVLAKMQEYISETLEGNNIKYNFEIDESIRDTQLDMQVRKELYLIFKEAVYNASKYAQCGFVNIVLRRKKDTCTLIIQDNGKGFDIAKIIPGNGIHNMQQRAAKMNSKISIKSEINKGTIIYLEFHIP